MTTDPVVTPSAAPYAARLDRLRERLRHAGLDYCFVGPSSDLRYLTGLDLHSSERLALLIVPQEAPAHLVVPAFEAAGLDTLPAGLRVAPWDETADPTALVAQLLRPPENGTMGTAAVGDQLWAIFLLRLQAALPRVTFCPAAEVLTPLRISKDAAEVAALVEAGARADDAFGEICGLRFTGRTEHAVAEDIAALLRRRGFSISWGPIVGSGPNGASPHHTASDRMMEAGDLVVLDYGGGLNGYNADMTRTVAVGHAPEGEMRQVYELVKQGQEAGVQAAKPGISGQELDSVVRDLFTAAGYGAFFTHRLGHGLGLDTHEAPYIVQGNALRLRPGMAFSIEPGLYLPGRFGVRIEDIVIVTEQGAQRMNNAPHDLVVVQ